MSDLDAATLEALAQRVAGDMASAMGILLLRIGEQTGLFTALARGPATSPELAERGDLSERYVREWAAAMAAAGYINYDPTSASFSLSPEQEQVFACESSPTYSPPFGDLLVGLAHDEPMITNAFRTGEGIPWSAHNGCLFCCTERRTGQTVVPQLIKTWLPKVINHIPPSPKIADIGCGRGRAVMAIASAMPQAQVYGFDLHRPSIDHATESASAAGLNNAHFIAGPAECATESGFDLAVIIDALHDMGDPTGVAKNVRKLLKPGGRFLVIEPFAADRLEDNFTTSGRFAYAVSTCVCTPAALSQAGGMALGAQAGYARLKSVLSEAGFSDITPIQNEPYNIVIEAVA